MKTKIQKLIDKVENAQHKVVRVTKVEFELETGDVYPHTFELDDNISIDEFQKLLNSSKKLVLEQIKRIDEETTEKESE